MRRTGSEEKILRAARELFLAAGYDGVNLDQIAERAGVSRQTIYNRFGSKEAVFRGMVRFHWEAFPEVGPVPGDGEAEPADVLRGFARSMQRFALEHDQIRFARLVVAESVRLPWIAEEFYRLGKRPVVAAFAGSLDRLVEHGRLRCADTTLAARQFMGLVQEFLVWPRVMGFDEEVAAQPGTEAVIEEAVGFFLDRHAIDQEGVR